MEDDRIAGAVFVYGSRLVGIIIKLIFIGHLGGIHRNRSAAARLDWYAGLVQLGAILILVDDGHGYVRDRLELEMEDDRIAGAVFVYGSGFVGIVIELIFIGHLGGIHRNRSTAARCNRNAGFVQLCTVLILVDNRNGNRLRFFRRYAGGYVQKNGGCSNRVTVSISDVDPNGAVSIQAAGIFDICQCQIAKALPGVILIIFMALKGE
jgi:hypothetical protein